MFSKTKQKAKQIVQTHGVTIGVVTGAAATYAVMRKFDLDVSQVRKQAYEQGREAGQIQMLLDEAYHFIKQQGLENEFVDFANMVSVEP